MAEALLRSAASAFLAFSISETRLFAPLRERVRRRSAWAGELVGCGYCLGFWFALALVTIYGTRLLDQWPALDLVLTSFVVAWLAAFQWAALCWLMTRAER